jgi:endonuclease/exonuclease/phosphatase family metal-dependent hydrolase
MPARETLHPEDRLRVATYNLYLGADLTLVFDDRPSSSPVAGLAEVMRQLGSAPFERRARLVAQVLAAEAPDLVGLQEVCTWSVDDHVATDFEALLLGALEVLGEPYEVVARQATFTGEAVLPPDIGRGRVDLAGHDVLLRRTSSPVEVLDTRVGTFGEAMTLAVLGGHQQTVTRGWCAAVCRRGADGDEFAFFTTHTEAYDKISRNRQRDELLAAVGKVAPNPVPVVLVGDFNATPDQVGLPPELADAWVAAGGDPSSPDAATSGQAADLRNERSELDTRIDFVFVRGMDVSDCRTVGASEDDRGHGVWPSDHACVVADLQIRQGLRDPEK